ncbi:MAG: GGDEF domain-containing protein [Clostridiales Family XIII bacterium]|jgi:diguanylate cyclase (GGDEF)-like protein|nr:GGDEF domain-containing protein [Clostridiales Family XIII bacterium]
MIDDQNLKKLTTQFFDNLMLNHAAVKIILVGVIVICCVYVVYCLFMSIRAHRERNVDDKYYIIYCIIATLFLTTFAVVNYVGNRVALSGVLEFLSFTLFVSMPAALAMHISSQVNYRSFTILKVLITYCLPIISVIFAVVNIVQGKHDFNFLILVDMGTISLIGIVYFIYYIALTIRGYLLCFSVFYQMPPQMRRSTYFILIAVTAQLVAFVISILFGFPISVLVIPIGVVITASNCYHSFFKASANNVIATSREFVFGNLDTVIFVLSNKGRILMWNRSNEQEFYPLPVPGYLSEFALYKKRVIDENHGIISEYDDNVISITKNGREFHMRFQLKPITNGTRQFGYLVEISEVTSIYEILRLFEDMSFIDQMTGLKNRNAYIRVATKIDDTKKNPVLIIVGDVNNLKKVNDGISHLAGDRLLTSMADIMKENAPDGAFIARIGGDELVLLIDTDDVQIAKDFIKNVEFSCHQIDDSEFGEPSISLGYSVFTGNGDFNASFMKADSMMYEHKTAYKSSKSYSSSGVIPNR